VTAHETAARTMKIKSLAELGALRDAMARASREAAERAARAAAERARLERRRADEHDLFARSVGRVHPLPDRQRAELALPEPPAHPRQREADERAALAESMSDEVTVESLLLTDDGLSFRRPGIGPDVVTRLRRGHWALQGQLDLHGYNRDEARLMLADWIRECHRRGMRCLRVVHGKGHGSPGKQPVLKAKVQRWLAQRDEVIAFAQASGPQGGAGALVVLLGGAPR
jgi:DNA-nicking Smr family endonuclease